MKMILKRISTFIILNRTHLLNIPDSSDKTSSSIVSFSSPEDENDKICIELGDGKKKYVSSVSSKHFIYPHKLNKKKNRIIKIKEYKKESCKCVSGCKNKSCFCLKNYQECNKKCFCSINRLKCKNSLALRNDIKKKNIFNEIKCRCSKSCSNNKCSCYRINKKCGINCKCLCKKTIVYKSLNINDRMYLDDLNKMNDEFRLPSDDSSISDGDLSS